MSIEVLLSDCCDDIEDCQRDGSYKDSTEAIERVTLLMNALRLYLSTKDEATNSPGIEIARQKLLHSIATVYTADIDSAYEALVYAINPSQN